MVLAKFWALDPQKKLQDRCGRGVERKKTQKARIVQSVLLMLLLPLMLLLMLQL